MNQLKRTLGLRDATGLVIGTIIGTGIFLKTAIMAEHMGSPGGVLLAWVIAGVLSFLGALTYAELGEVYPEAGGEFIYLKEGHGDLVAFLYGWQRFFISSPGTIAAYAVGAATFLASGLGTPVIPLALAFIFIFTLFNLTSVHTSGLISTALSILKALLIICLSAALFIGVKKGPVAPFVLVRPSSLGLAVLAALWAFDGWNNLSMAAGEIKNPKRNIPWALLLGLGLVLGLYALANMAYFHALPLSEIIHSNSASHPNELPVASKAAKLILGEKGQFYLSFLLVLSALGAMHGSILTNARVPYAMAEKNLFPSIFRKLSAQHIPYFSVITQGLLSMLLAISGTFDQLTDYVVFASWIFYALNAYGVLKARKKLPTLERNFKVPTPIPYLFCLMAFLLLLNCLWTMPKESGIGLLLILLGIPAFIYQKK